jgi:branched-chain amino acid aminotransferase
MKINEKINEKNTAKNIEIIPSKHLKVKPPVQELGFGKYFSDHMFIAHYSKKAGWHSAQITPYQALQIEPGASALHYGQALFEGMKAFRQTNGDCVLFRPEFNWKRLCDGAERLCMVAPPKDLMLDGVRQLVKIDRDWIPSQKGASLYIRPTLIGSESFLGVRPSEEYIFFVICSPVASYYAEGSSPIKIWVEEKYIRAAPGGLGATKAGANYAASLKAALEAKKRDYAQVLWLDVNHEYVEEVGTMNVFFAIGDEVITPPLSDSILPGGVRDCVITLLKKMNLKISERKISIRDIHEAHQNQKLREVFGTGTAAIISPVGELSSERFKMKINNGERGPIAQKLYEEITAIQYGDISDSLGWIEKL